MRTLILAALMVCFVCCSAKESTHRGTDSCQELKLATLKARQLVHQPGDTFPACRMVDRNEFLAIGASLISKEVSDEELALQEQIFKSIGLIPNDYRYQFCIKEAYTSEASAFFSPTLQAVIIPDWLEIPEAIFVHEANHFLQHEVKDHTLDPRFSGWFHDAALSIGAMLEGDSLRLEDTFLQTADDALPEQALPDEGRLVPMRSDCELPETLKRLFYFQYDHGVLFWERLHRFAPELKREAVLKNPPIYTREIIDPKRYLARLQQDGERTEQLLCGDLPSGPSAFKKIRFGEHLLRTIIETRHPRHQSFLAARGLEDDCFLVFKGEDGTFSFEWVLDVPNEKDQAELLRVLDAVHSTYSMRGRPKSLLYVRF